MSETVYGGLAVRAHGHRQAPAILAPGRRPLTFNGLNDQIEEAARRLRSLGVARRDRVAIVLPNGPEAAAALFAVAS